MKTFKISLPIFSLMALSASALTACDMSPEAKDAREFRRLWKSPEQFCQSYMSRHPIPDKITREDIFAYNLSVCAENGYGMAADPKRADRWMEMAVQMGDTELLRKLLERSLHGDGQHPPNPAEAVRWLGEAAVLGDTQARDQLVSMTLNGTKDYPPNPTELARWLEKLSDMDDDDAQHWLLDLYMNGVKGFPPQPAAAERLLGKMLKRHENDADLMYQLGLVLSVQQPAGLPLSNNVITWFSRAAEGGNAKAQYFMGNHLLQRHRDKAKRNSNELLLQSYRYFTKAALQGHVDALCQQAILLWTEPAVHSSDAEAAHRWAERSTYYSNNRSPYPTAQNEAIPLFQKAAAAGSAEAHFWLGKMYAAGNQYLKPDAAKALEYLEKGAELGSNSAIILLADHLLKGDLGKQDIERARGLLEGLAVQDNAAASFRLGMMYCGDDGSGVPANPEKAVKYLKTAASAYHGEGTDRAALRLGKIFEFGLNKIAKDPKEALKWYKQAAHEHNIEASLRMGRVYENGELGEERDLYKALSWYSNTYRLSNEIMWRYASVGRRTENNASFALHHIIKAAKAGYPEACRELAEMTARGEAKEWDLNAAWNWADRGFQLDGNPGGYYAVAAILLGLPGPWDSIVPDKVIAPLLPDSEEKYLSMRRPQRQQFLRKAAMANNDETRELAVEKLKFASSEGSREASLALADLYSTGKYVPKSAEEAKKYRELAKSQKAAAPRPGEKSDAKK